VPTIDALNTIYARYEAHGEARHNLFDKTAYPTQEQYDESGDMILARFDSVGALPADRTQTISILPLVDSITEKWGKVSHCYGPRQGLHAAGWTNIDYVGTQKDPGAADFAPDHEGSRQLVAQEL
jgi:hypothetical protein